MSVSINGSGSIFGIDQGLNVTGIVTANGGLNVTGIVTANGGLNVTSGLVGIGIDNPSTKIHLVDSVPSGTSNVFIDNTGGDSVIYLLNNDQYSAGLGTLADNGSYIELSGKWNSTNTNANRTFGRIGAFKENNTSADGAGYLSLYSRPDGGGLTERLRITGIGSVGIGTDDPRTKLHIDASTNAESRITISRSGFLRNNFIGLDGDADELVIAADEDDQGASSHIKFKVDGTEELRIDSNGLKFNGDTAAANALDDYEEGNITTWRLVKSGASTAGSNNEVTHIRYTKIGRCVYISGHIRTDSTEDSQSGNLLLVTVADATVAATLPFTPNHSGGLPIIHTRSVDELDHPISLAFVKDSATIYIYANGATGDYIADSNTLSTNTQTNIVITFNGHFFTDS